MELELPRSVFFIRILVFRNLFKLVGFFILGQSLTPAALLGQI
jgi:hypothetical protein